MDDTYSIYAISLFRKGKKSKIIYADINIRTCRARYLAYLLYYGLKKNAQNLFMFEYIIEPKNYYELVKATTCEISTDESIELLNDALNDNRLQNMYLKEYYFA